MPDQPLFIPMSPERFQPFEDLDSCFAVARDEQFRMLWCSKNYGAIHGRNDEDLIGTPLDALIPPKLAREREALARRVHEQQCVVSYQQLALGVRWLTRVWPLDPDAFDRPGYFLVVTKMTEPGTGSGDTARVMEFVSSADLGDLAVLSRRELEVFYYLGGGMSATEIAETLHRSPKTISRHVENIYKKMGYSSRPDLVRDAVARGLVSFTEEEWHQLTDPKA